MAVRRQAAVEDLAMAEKARADIAPIYDLASAWVRDAQDTLKLIDLTMEAAKRDHAIRVALAEQGIEYAKPTTIIVERYSSMAGHPNPFHLVAVGREGTGLYLHTPEHSHRFQGKAYARLLKRGEKPLRDGPDNYTGQREEKAGLTMWNERGKGQWGAGSGSIKPMAPPEGGRWRWLKVREQAELAETAA